MKPTISIFAIPLFFFIFLPTKSFPININNKENKTTFDRCSEWDSTNEYKHLYTKLCEYESGGSGYYQFKNNYDKNVRFSFKIYHKNGKVTKGSTNVKSGQTHKASCYSCAQKNGGGNESYVIENVFFEGEEGYW
ncbi:MAG: hypothetical protein WDZ45_01260 [Flavobacteriaceae bacterium]